MRGHELRGGRRSLMAQASAHAGNGADVLFARLDATTQRAGEGEAALRRLAERIHNGEWTPEIADLVARALALEAMQNER